MFGWWSYRWKRVPVPSHSFQRMRLRRLKFYKGIVFKINFLLILYFRILSIYIFNHSSVEVMIIFQIKRFYVWINGGVIAIRTHHLAIPDLPIALTSTLWRFEILNDTILIIQNWRVFRLFQNIFHHLNFAEHHKRLCS